MKTKLHLSSAGLIYIYKFNQTIGIVDTDTFYQLGFNSFPFAINITNNKGNWIDFHLFRIGYDAEIEVWCHIVLGTKYMAFVVLEFVYFLYCFN